VRGEEGLLKLLDKLIKAFLMGSLKPSGIVERGSFVLLD
jgi:hypothetical protein